MKIIVFLIPLLLAVACASLTGTADHGQQTVERVDLERYMGKWYEIAAFPNWFQQDCTCTMAEYQLSGDHVSVKNSCRKGSAPGRLEVATGKAYPVSGSNNARLKVQFFWPFKGDYWVLALDADYRYAMVGHPGRKYLWILSRTPEMSDRVYQSLVEKAAQQGYDVSKIRKTRCNEADQAT